MMCYFQNVAKKWYLLKRDGIPEYEGDEDHDEDIFHDQLVYGDVNFAKEDRLNDQDGLRGEEDSLT